MRQRTIAVDRYTACQDLWVITAYFNPCHYRTRMANYRAFAASMQRSSIHLFTVECAFNDDSYELDAAPTVIQVRSADVLWQKERLLNLAVSRLPAEVTKVAWIDCDVLFANPNWAVEASRLLEHVPVVQLFDQAIRLERDQQSDQGTGRHYHGWVASRERSRTDRSSSSLHGHPGFAWAAQRSLLQAHGLYDVAFDVEADHLMAHAFYGEFDTECMRNAMSAGRRISSPGWTRPVRHILHPLLRLLRRGPHSIRRVNHAFQAHYLDWARAFHIEMEGHIAYVPGTLLHLWHGDLALRKAPPIRAELHRRSFDPAQHTQIAATGTWTLMRDHNGLRRLAHDLFQQRQEDGVREARR